ncbi:MAG: hypothetical protein KME21_03555 [Desmonostoc vinosum HA7617-LM4]|jgi:hypothetical protein|nr:hypothetical protein [Desmonostoc vinosum HA7617-LM4]
MLRKIGAKATILTLISTCLISCGSATVEEYEQFAEAGKNYTIALDSLLETSGNYFVDANSERLIRNDLGKPETDQKNYEDVTKSDEQWLILIGRMRRHTGLVRRYFEQLGKLAGSDASQRGEKATAKIATELVSLGNSIRETPPVNSSSAALVTSKLTNIIIKVKIGGALKREINARKDAIYKELETQDLVLQLLKQQLQTNIRTIQNNQDERLVFQPYVDETPISAQDDWIAKRREIRTMTLQVEALENASKASEAFKEAFKALLEDDFNLARANSFLLDVDTLLKVAEELKEQSEAK